MIIGPMKEDGKKEWKYTDKQLGDEDTKMISETLKVNTTLTSLNLGSDDKILKQTDIIKRKKEENEQ